MQLKINLILFIMTAVEVTFETETYKHQIYKLSDHVRLLFWKLALAFLPLDYRVVWSILRKYAWFDKLQLCSFGQLPNSPILQFPGIHRKSGVKVSKDNLEQTHKVFLNWIKSFLTTWHKVRKAHNYFSVTCPNMSTLLLMQFLLLTTTIHLETAFYEIPNVLALKM